MDIVVEEMDKRPQHAARSGNVWCRWRHSIRVQLQHSTVEHRSFTSEA